MSVETALALIGFAFVMSISPGPSNFLLLASGANFGFARSISLVLGISTGFLTMVLGVGLGLGQVLEQFPLLYSVLRFLCGAFVVWLALKIARSRSLGLTNTEGISKPISFVQGALFQLVNPKAWAVALIVTVSYTTPEDYLTSLVIIILLFAMIAVPSMSVWAIFGSALRNCLAKGRRIAVFNVAMAILLVASMVPVILRAG